MSFHLLQAKMFALKIITFYSPGEIVSMRKSISTMTRGLIAIYFARVLIIFPPAVPLFKMLFINFKICALRFNLSIPLLFVDSQCLPPPLPSKFIEKRPKQSFLSSSNLEQQSKANKTKLGAEEKMKRETFYLF